MLYLCWTQKKMERSQWEKRRKRAVIKSTVVAALWYQTKPVHFLSRLFSFKQLSGEGELDTWKSHVFHRDGINVSAEEVTAGTCIFTFKVIQNHKRSYWCSGLCERWLEVDRNAINNVWRADSSKHFIIRAFRHSRMTFGWLSPFSFCSSDIPNLLAAVLPDDLVCGLEVRVHSSIPPPPKKKRKTALIPQIWPHGSLPQPAWVSLLDCWRTLQIKCGHLNTFLYLRTF